MMDRIMDAIDELYAAERDIQGWVARYPGGALVHTGPCSAAGKCECCADWARAYGRSLAAVEALKEISRERHARMQSEAMERR